MKIIKISAVWCSGCLAMKKTWKEIKEKFPNIEITEYDYDLDNDKIKELNIGEILPVTIFINQKEERLIGEQTKDQIINKIEEML